MSEIKQYSIDMPDKIKDDVCIKSDKGAKRLVVFLIASVVAAYTSILFMIEFLSFLLKKEETLVTVIIVQLGFILIIAFWVYQSWMSALDLISLSRSGLKALTLEYYVYSHRGLIKEEKNSVSDV